MTRPNNKKQALRILNLRGERFHDVPEFNRAVGCRLVELRTQFWPHERNLTKVMPLINETFPDVPYSTWASWENGTRSLSPEMARDIGYAFNAHPAWILFGGEKRPYPGKK